MIESELPEFLNTYDSLDRIVEKADFWRYAVIYVYGGVYVDSDVTCIKPVRFWNENFITKQAELSKFNREMLQRSSKTYNKEDKKEDEHETYLLPELIVGLEHYSNDGNLGWFASKVQFTNWAFAGNARHPFLLQLLKNIRTLVEAEKSGTKSLGDNWYINVLKRTGPGMLSESLKEWLEERGWKPEDVIHGNPIVGGIGFLEEEAFGTIYRGEDQDRLDSHNIFVLHHFYGTWK
jgi:mannosyltransferase OCH1-like enzyme